MNVLSWIVLGLVIWAAVAVIVGFAIGSVVRRRDRQIPHDDDPE